MFKKIIFLSIFLLSFIKVTYANYSLKCVMESHYKFFDRENWETNILPMTFFIKDNTIEYITDKNKIPAVHFILEDNENSLIAYRIYEFQKKSSIGTIVLDKNENRITFMSSNALGLTVYSGICH